MITRRQMASVAAVGAQAAGAAAGKTVNPRIFSFVARPASPANGTTWTITRISAVIGDTLPAAAKLDYLPGLVAGQPWALHGATSNLRYTTHAEKVTLSATQAALRRPECTLGALIPIRKNQAWWDLPQDDRRKIFEDTSHHVQVGTKYLPEIARRLHHCRDLSEAQPFDFLTWFDYAPQHAALFEDLVGALRHTEEWSYIDREVDIRLSI